MTTPDNVFPFPGFEMFQKERGLPELLTPGRDRADFIVRVELDDAEPPIWRRLRLAGDLTLEQLHGLLQVAMGWQDSHLHRFDIGPGELDRDVAPFLTDYDISMEGETGVAEAEVRLDQVLGEPGDRLYYEYDFGDSWSHTISLERIEPRLDGDPLAICLDGSRACPPEDVGGVWGYANVLQLLAGDSDNVAGRSLEEVLQWLPDGFDPDRFSVDAVNTVLRTGPMPDLTQFHPLLSEFVRRAGGSPLSDMGQLIKEALAAGPTPTEAEVGDAVRPYTALLAEIGAGVKLTAAGYLPVRSVAALVTALDVEPQWRRANLREADSIVLAIRESAASLGLFRKSRGELLPTKLGIAVARDPARLFAHIRGKLPLGREQYERDAGMIMLLLQATGVKELWPVSERAGAFLGDLGWRVEGDNLGVAAIQSSAPTRDVLRTLGVISRSETVSTALAKALLRT